MKIADLVRELQLLPQDAEIGVMTAAGHARPPVLVRANQWASDGKCGMVENSILANLNGQTAITQGPTPVAGTAQENINTTWFSDHPIQQPGIVTSVSFWAHSAGPCTIDFTSYNPATNKLTDGASIYVTGFNDLSHAWLLRPENEVIK